MVCLNVVLTAIRTLKDPVLLLAEKEVNQLMEELFETVREPYE